MQRAPESPLDPGDRVSKGWNPLVRRQGKALAESWTLPWICEASRSFELPTGALPTTWAARSDHRLQELAIPGAEGRDDCSKRNTRGSH